MATYTRNLEDDLTTATNFFYTAPSSDEWIVGEDSLGIQIGSEILPE